VLSSVTVLEHHVSTSVLYWCVYVVGFLWGHSRAKNVSEWDDVCPHKNHDCVLGPLLYIILLHVTKFAVDFVVCW